jgi:hypothetical protein
MCGYCGQRVILRFHRKIPAHNIVASSILHFIGHSSSNAKGEEFDWFIITWGGNGLQAARKKRLGMRENAEPMDLEICCRTSNLANFGQAGRRTCHC